MKPNLILIMLFTFSLQACAQFKYEKESRVKENDVPTNAIKYVDSINFNSRVKWYKEIGLNTTSFEAKTKYKGKKYSIEFSEDGSFEDIEMEIKSNEIAAETFKIISKYLSENHDKYSIEKIQIQYSGNKNLILEYLQNNNENIGFETRYEIVISSKVDGSFTMLEYLFSKNGKFIQKTQITLNRTDNIEY
jgi:hypothetical protein